jgi:hypothetical protein
MDGATGTGTGTDQNRPHVDACRDSQAPSAAHCAVAANRFCFVTLLCQLTCHFPPIRSLHSRLASSGHFCFPSVPFNLPKSHLWDFHMNSVSRYLHSSIHAAAARVHFLTPFRLGSGHSLPSNILSGRHPVSYTPTQPSKHTEHRHTEPCRHGVYGMVFTGMVFSGVVTLGVVTLPTHGRTPSVLPVRVGDSHGW